MKKRLLLIAGFLCLLVLAGAFVWRIARPVPPASTDRIPLPDGSWVHLEAVTYGTNHLVGPRLALLSYRMPQRVRLLMLRVFGKHAGMRFMTATPRPQLVLWLNRGPYANRFPTDKGYMECFITDTNGFVAGENIYYGAPYPLEAKPFTIFPRREPEFLLKMYHRDPSGGIKECGQMRIANPQHGHYPQWQPEVLPATRQVGDVEATLHRLIANVPQNTGTRRLPGGRWMIEAAPLQPGQAPKNFCLLALRSLSSPDVQWRVASVEVSDATGNRIRSSTVSLNGYGRDGVMFGPGLWTNESAWKLTCEIKRTTGFAPGEQFTLHDVPLGAMDQTNLVGWTTNFNGVNVTLTSLVRRPPAIENLFSSSNLTRVEFALSGLTNGVHLDLLAAVAGDGTELKSMGHGSGADRCSYEFGNVPREARTADFTFVVHQSRTVEFLVKPEIAPEPFQITVEAQ